MLNLFKNEMERTKPPPVCEDCEKLSEDCCDFQDNRVELYQKFALMFSDIPGEMMYVCKKCLRSAFSRETLYRITGVDGKTRTAWITERVKCNSCGREWKREEKKVHRIPITEV